MSPRQPPPFSVGDVRVNPIRAPKSGSERWYWRATRPIGAGRRETVWTGRATREEALQAVARWQADGPSEPALAAEVQVVTVADLLAFYIGGCEERVAGGDLAPRSLVAYRNKARVVKRLIGHVHLDRLDVAHVSSMRDRALAAGRSPQSVRGDLSLLTVAWRWGQDRGLCDARTLGRVRVTVRRRVYTEHTPTRAEFWRALDAVEALARCPDVGQILRLLAATGLRIREATGLRVDDVDLQRRTLRVRGGKTPRVVPLADPAVDVLQAALAERATGAVWPGGDLLTRRVQQNLARLDWDALGQTRFSPHAIRRMVVIELLAAGVDPAVEARILGHSPTVAMRYYRQVRQEDLDNALAVAALGERQPGNVVSFRRAR